jgi:hypothetical protein
MKLPEIERLEADGVRAQNWKRFGPGFETGG